MLKQNPINISPATRYQNAALNYYLGLTDSSFLHYGYWAPLPASSEELTIERLRIAQEAYAAKLFAFIPQGVKTVLDVGCGIGGNASYLLDRNFVVEGLAPDPFQQEQFLRHTNDRAVFHLSQFESFKSTHTYDLILLSESSQYMSAGDIAQCAANLLNPGGSLLLADMMRSDINYKQGIFSNCHVVAELETALQQAGFTSVKTEDISTQIAPTIDLCVENFRRFGLNTIRYLSDLVAIAVPPLHKLLRWMFYRWVHRLIVEALDARHIFEKHLCYQVQLWQLSKPHEH
jgi:MPBQ/MSBQ methyltransferase